MKKQGFLWLCLFLCLVLAATMLPMGSVAAEEAAPDTMTVAQLQVKYPHGTYWNHTKGGTEDYTTSPCTHHSGNCTYSGSCGCNSYRGKTIQCMGFAYQLASLAYGGDPRSEWTTYESSSALDHLKPGDIVRYSWNGHSIFVTAVEGDTVTYADANGDGHCQIQWNRTTTKDTIKRSFTSLKEAPYALPNEENSQLSVAASAKSVTVGQEVTLTLTYRGGEKTIGGLMGTLNYDAALFSYVSAAGDGVEVSGGEGVAKFLYYAADAQAPKSVTFTVTLRALAAGSSEMTVTTEELVDDTDYSSVGTPTAKVAVAVTAPTLTVGYHAGGGTIPNKVVGYTYRVESSNGLNMRKDAGTGNARVTALPNKTVFTVMEGDTKEADGYTWGKTTFNGKTGWVVISQYVVKTGDVWGGDWTLTDGVVCRTDCTPLIHMVSYGQPMEDLADVTALGLTKEGHRFAGWCTAEDGTGVVYAAGMKPEELCPDGGDTLTLYALWVPIVLGDADGNGRLNNRDLGLLQRYVNGWDVTLCPEADINADGTLNNKDLGLLQLALNEE